MFGVKSASKSVAENEEAKRRLQIELEDLVQLRPMPSVALKLLDVVRQSQPDIKQIVETIQCDPAIAMRVLAVSNSPLYGYTREIVSINQAVVVLGFRNLCQLAVTIASGDVFSKGDVAVQPRRELYEHSLACATVSRLLTPTEPTIDSGTAFLAGMLHDVGKLVFLDLAPDGYTRLRIDSPHVCSTQFETENYGMDHTEVGLAYAEAWGLPFEINLAISEHHLAPSGNEVSLSTVTSLANALTKHWGIGAEPCAEDDLLVHDWISKNGESNAERMRGAAFEQYEAVRNLCAA